MMETDDSKQTRLPFKLDAKDYLLLVPTIATGLAVIYELGSFYPLGTVAFSLFSVTDHLLWALQILPYSIATVVISIIAIVIFEALRGNAKAPSSEKRGRTRQYLSTLLNMCVGSAFLVYGWHERSGTLIVIGIFLFILAPIPKNRAL